MWVKCPFNYVVCVVHSHKVFLIQRSHSTPPLLLCKMYFSRNLEAAGYTIKSGLEVRGSEEAQHQVFTPGPLERLIWPWMNVLILIWMYFEKHNVKYLCSNTLHCNVIS